MVLLWQPFEDKHFSKHFNSAMAGSTACCHVGGMNRFSPIFTHEMVKVDLLCRMLG